MSLTINTELLKEMVARVVRGASNNKLIPLSSLMLIELSNNELTLVTTDATNYLYITKPVEGEDFYIVVQAEQFSKLISKLTCQNVVLDITDSALEVKGNGSYKIDIPLDDGEFIKYPDPLKDIKLNKKSKKEIAFSDIQTILVSCKSALATTFENPCYTGYYVGDRVITTNQETISALNKKLLGKDVLISSEYMDLLSVMTTDKVTVYIVDNDIVCQSDDCTVYGKLMEEVGDFAYDEISELLDKEFNSSCEFSKSAILSLLERISLFVGDYDDFAIQLLFTEEGLQIESMKSNGVEVIPYIKSNEFSAFKCLMDIRSLTNIIKAYPDDAIVCKYGDDSCLKFESADLTFIIGTIEEGNE